MWGRTSNNGQTAQTADTLPAILRVVLNNGIEMPQLGVGTSTLKETAAECVKHAIGLGYRLVDVGKIRAIGVSNFNPHHVDELLAYARIKPVVNQIKIHPYMEHQEVVGNTFAKGIQVQ
ncbi:hypothetical protein F2Z85_01395 [Bacteroides fragilis]|uniref:NADP-dependent oxidoreductase domain-containing protein n=1 Tax=Bacteroides fragilis TaxID=817 RepID=A0A642F9R1_BACFG|nr:glyoxal reductase [Bacteroides fragilis str. S23 R14]EYA66362.1 glyoxal reductase [Bacteroides fragilis str. S23L24]KAA4792130.1 hypothetical protein F3B20_03310 [Bacteroides fragilis]EXZ99674.1 glyoxal reductase [Bacteroides fragilis str. S23 R14]EYA01564.1 glyoxal reductase [Bacteroides fragilis str. S23 R14]